MNELAVRSVVFGRTDATLVLVEGVDRGVAGGDFRRHDTRATHTAVRTKRQGLVGIVRGTAIVRVRTTTLLTG